MKNAPARCFLYNSHMAGGVPEPRNVAFIQDAEYEKYKNDNFVQFLFWGGYG